VADGNNHRVQKFLSSGKFETAFGEEGDQAGGLQYPTALRVAMDGSVLVCDLNGGRIQRFDSGGHFMYELMFPGNAGSVSDFEIDPDDRLLAALRRSNAILKLEVS
jgi:hypothetical protein